MHVPVAAPLGCRCRLQVVVDSAGIAVVHAGARHYWFEMAVCAAPGLLARVAGKVVVLLELVGPAHDAASVDQLKALPAKTAVVLLPALQHGDQLSVGANPAALMVHSTHT